MYSEPEELDEEAVAKLFSTGETRKIIDERDQFEYTLRTDPNVDRCRSGRVPLSRLLDFVRPYVEYIKSERQLGDRVKIRAAQQQCEQKLEAQLMHNTRRIYRLAVERYPSCSRLWQEFAVFSARNFQTTDADREALRKLYADWQKHHGQTEPRVWLEAIRWERTVAEGTAFVLADGRTQQLIGQAMRLHPQCQELCREVLNVQLCGMAGVEEVVRVNRALTHYRIMCNSNTACTFHVAMLDEATAHPFAVRLQAAILEHMIEHCRFEALFWHTIAQRELLGLSTFDDKMKAQLKPTEPPPHRSHKQALKQWHKDRMVACAMVYQKSTEILPIQPLWQYYLDAMLFPKHKKELGCSELSRQLLGRALRQADEADWMVSTAQYETYLKLLDEERSDTAFVVKVLERAVAKFGFYAPLWIALMRKNMKLHNNAEIHKLFRVARRKVQEPLPIWQLYRQWLMIDREGNAEKITELFQSAVRQSDAAFDPLKVAYLDWVYESTMHELRIKRNEADAKEEQEALANGREKDKNAATTNDTMENECMEKVRFAFRWSIQEGKPCLAMVDHLVEMEMQQLELKMSTISNALKFATSRFGSDRTDVWLKMIKFYQMYDPTEVGAQVAEAKSRLLTEQLRQTFENELDIMLQKA